MKTKKRRARRILSNLLSKPELIITEDLLRGFVGGQVLAKHTGSHCFQGYIEGLVFSAVEGNRVITITLKWLAEKRLESSSRSQRVWRRIKDRYELPVDIGTIVESTDTSLTLLTKTEEKVRLLVADHPQCIKEPLKDE